MLADSYKIPFIFPLRVATVDGTTLRTYLPSAPGLLGRAAPCEARHFQKQGCADGGSMGELSVDMNMDTDATWVA